MRHCSRTDATSCHTHLVVDFHGRGVGHFAAPDHDYPSHLELDPDRDRLARAERIRKTVDASSRRPCRSRWTSQPERSARSRSAPTRHPRPFTADGTSPKSKHDGHRDRRRRRSARATYSFSSWSDGGAVTHAINTGGRPTRRFKATYRAGDGEAKLAGADVIGTRTSRRAVRPRRGLQDHRARRPARRTACAPVCRRRPRPRPSSALGVYADSEQQARDAARPGARSTGGDEPAPGTRCRYPSGDRDHRRAPPYWIGTAEPEHRHGGTLQVARPRRTAPGGAEQDQQERGDGRPARGLDGRRQLHRRTALGVCLGRPGGAAHTRARGLAGVAELQRRGVQDAVGVSTPAAGR